MSLRFAGSKVLVLGGRGFLGQHLIAELLRENVSVRIFDRVNTSPIETAGTLKNIEHVHGDFVEGHDLARALLLAGQRAQSGVFNIGSGVGHSINDVLRLIRKQTGLSGEVRYLPGRRFDVQRTYLNIERARTTLGWQPQYSLEEGFARYWKLLLAAARAPELR
jgi:UDP-glucose 4-epimerase